MLQSTHDRAVDPMLLLMSAEAWLHFGGFVNAKNARHWDDEIPTQYMGPRFLTEKWVCGVLLVVGE
jgi:hypothetical protein